MSRVGKLPIDVPAGVKVSIAAAQFKATGPQGTLELTIRPEVKVEIKENVIEVAKVEDTRLGRSLHGLTRTLLANMVKGVHEGFEKKLEIVGVGYKAEVQGDNVKLVLGYSQPVNFTLPKGVKAVIEKQTSITLKGADKQAVGQVAANIRSLRKPEPYKGKGIKYSDEIIRRKAGKAGKVAGGAS